MSTNELEIINSHRMINKYDNSSVIKPLKESPGFLILEPTKVADGYWDYEKGLYKHNMSCIHWMYFIKMYSNCINMTGVVDMQKVVKVDYL